LAIFALEETTYSIIIMPMATEIRYKTMAVIYKIECPKEGKIRGKIRGGIDSILDVHD